MFIICKLIIDHYKNLNIFENMEKNKSFIKAMNLKKVRFMKNYEQIIFALIFLSLATTTLAQEKGHEAKDESYAKAVSLIESGQYKFVAGWAYTQKGRQVDLTTNPNFLTVADKEATAELPYFGVINGGAATGYGSGDSGLKFNSELANYEVSKKDKKRRLIVTFRAKQGTEVLNCTLTVNGPESVTLVVSSSLRQSIRYTGKLIKE